VIRCLLLLTVAAHAETVQGVAVNSVTGKPVAGATVQLIGIVEEAEPDIYRGRSDGAGRFRFEGVVPGHYRAIADAPGFTRMGFNNHSPTITVDATATVREMKISLIPASVISGRVVDQDGDPLPYVSVETLQYTYQGGKKALRSLHNMRTDDRGEYRIYGLTPGRYYVRAMLRAGQNTGYSPTFYPGVHDVAQASLLEAAPGGETRSIDIMLRADSFHSISGKVVDGQTGQPVANVYVTAGTSDGFANGGPQISDAFTIHNLVPGKYVLLAQQFSGGGSKTARQTVELGSADLTGVLLTLSAGVDIPGTVRAGSDVPDGADKIQFALYSDDNTVNALANTKGGFVFQNVRPDHYRLSWLLPKGFYVKSIKMGDKLLADDRIDLTGAAAPLAIQLAGDGGRVQGVVRNPAGEPVAGAVVTLTADPSYDFWSATSDEKGQFEIRDIAPGDYRLLAFDGAPEGAPQDPDFRKPYADKATQVQVLPSTQQKIDVVAVGR